MRNEVKTLIEMKHICLVLTLMFVGLWNFTNAQTWTQQGMDIDGEQVNDRSGSSVSMPDNNTVAIGARDNNGNGTDAGHVRVYEFVGNNWMQKGLDIDGEAIGDESGIAVSMPDNNTLAVGASLNDGNGVSTGHVRIHSWNGNSWQQKGIDIDGELVDDQSGFSVSMPDNNTVAIGAPQNAENGFNAGHVRIYRWNGTAWQQKGLDIDGEAIGDQLGWSVSMPDSNTVAIGAKTNDGTGTDAGHVRIYEWIGNGWIQKGIDIDGESSYDESGWSVSMPDSRTVAIGAKTNDGNGSNSGQVRVYTWTNNTWIQKGIDLDGEASGDQSGWSVSMPDSNTVAIGALQNGGNGSNSGHARIYRWYNGQWQQKGTDIDGEASNDYSGRTVSMPTPNTVAIGANLNDGNGSNSGHARIYICSPTSSTTQISACGSYSVPSGDETYFNSQTVMDTIFNSMGCDSIMTIELTINTVDISVVNTAPTLMANASAATYQWLDCNDNFSTINGEVQQSFDASSNGTYAVEIAQNGCIDTSACLTVLNVDVIEGLLENGPTVYPNPTSGDFSIDLGKLHQLVTIDLFNMTGQKVFTGSYSQAQFIRINIDEPVGPYLVAIKSDEKQTIFRIMKD